LPRCPALKHRYLRLKWLAGKVLGGECSWPAAWRWRSTNDVSASAHAADAAWLDAWVAQRCLPAEPDEISLLQFTSSSTGQPKGVLISTRSLVNNILAMRLAMRGIGPTGQSGPTGQICMVAWLPQYHDMGLIGGCLLAPVLGFRADLMSPATFLQNPATWLAAISQLHETHQALSALPNFGYMLCLRRVKDSELRGLRLSHWKCALNGAEPVRADTLSEFNARYAPHGFSPTAWACSYGLAENCVYVAGAMEEPVCVPVRHGIRAGEVAMPPLAREAGESPTSIDCPGCLLLEEWRTLQAVRIVHPETLLEVPEGTVGEIWVAGRSAARGYWGLPEESASKFGAQLAARDGARWPPDATPHIRSGDLGFMWQSRLFVLGRLEDVLTFGGRTLYAHNLERHAERGSRYLRPGCCAAFSVRPKGQDSEELVLMAELWPEAPTDGAQLRRVVRGMAAAMGERDGPRPFSIVLVKARAILKTTSGKLRRRACREAYLQMATAREANAASSMLIPMNAVLLLWTNDAAPATAANGTAGAHRHTCDTAGAPARTLRRSGTPSPANSAQCTPLPQLPAPLEVAHPDSARRPVAQLPSQPAANGTVPHPVVDGAPRLTTILSLGELHALAAECLGSDLSPDAPLMDAGFDSVSALELQGELALRLGMDDLPETLMFDFPTLRLMAAHFNLTDPSASEAAVTGLFGAAGRCAVSLGPIVGSLAGGVSTAGARALLSRTAADTISEVPLARWLIDGPDFPEGLIGERARHGGFLHGAELFDNAFFGVSLTEARYMDPQQRLLLERGYEALHCAGTDGSALMGSDCGVFLGIAGSDFQHMSIRTPMALRGVYIATGSSHSVASGRISFVLGLQGPCVSYDTACSAALTANHGAMRALQHCECDLGLVLGVSMMLLPDLHVAFAMVGMLSPRGHCHTFDNRADGYARSEACCAVALYTSGARALTPPTEHLLGSCVRQDGKSASLTAPNGQAQRGLLRPHSPMRRLSMLSLLVWKPMALEPLLAIQSRPGHSHR